jgi:hypothetical protein
MWIRRLALPVRLVSGTIAAMSIFCLGGCAATHKASHATSTTSSTAAPQPKPVSCKTVNISYEPKLQDQHIHCVLSIKDLTLDVSSDPAWSFSLRDENGVVHQFSEPVSDVGQAGVAPLLQDIDGSGTPALLVVLDIGGSGGEPMAVWRLTGSPPRFVRAGELFGFRQFYRTSEGFFGNYAHSSAVSGTVTLYRWVDDKLVAGAVLDMQAAEADPATGDDRGWVHNGNVLCALNEDDYPAGARAQRTAVLEAAGIDPATAQERFCGQSWVASVYR